MRVRVRAAAWAATGRYREIQGDIGRDRGDMGGLGGDAAHDGGGRVGRVEVQEALGHLGEEG